jgi:hypothetical protein
VTSKGEEEEVWSHAKVAVREISLSFILGGDVAAAWAQRIVI